jgi:hypothetical protein
MIGQEEMVLRDLAVPAVRTRPEGVPLEETERMPGIREKGRKREERKAGNEEYVFLPLAQG